jgi:hypothetical protein
MPLLVETVILSIPALFGVAGVVHLTTLAPLLIQEQAGVQLVMVEAVEATADTPHPMEA